MKLFNWKNEISKDELMEVIDALKNDKLVVVPTETVYGIAANAYSNKACKKIFDAKGRAQDNPLIIHVSDKEMISRIVEKPNEIEEKLIDSFMPGPFTLILKKKDLNELKEKDNNTKETRVNKAICDIASCGNKTIGIRMPSSDIIHTIIKQSNIPIAAPSANISGRPSGTCIEDITSELEERVDIIIDGGKSKIGIESTVVKVIDGLPTILRPGYVTEDDIRNVIGNVALSDKLLKKVEKNEKPLSPGMKYKHYAPNTKCILVENQEDQIDKINNILKNEDACVLGFREDRKLINISDENFILLGSRYNLEEISQNVFTALRKVDRLGVKIAIIEGIEKKGLGLSIMNRLVRACENNVI